MNKNSVGVYRFGFRTVPKRQRKRRTQTGLLLALALAPITAQAAPVAHDIMKQERGDQTGRATPWPTPRSTRPRPTASRISRSSRGGASSSSDGSHYNTLTRFLEPAEVREEAILFLEHWLRRERGHALSAVLQENSPRGEPARRAGASWARRSATRTSPRPCRGLPIYFARARKPAPITPASAGSIESIPATDSVQRSHRVPLSS